MTRDCNITLACLDLREGLGLGEDMSLPWEGGQRRGAPDRGLLALSEEDLVLGDVDLATQEGFVHNLGQDRLA